MCRAKPIVRPSTFVLLMALSVAPLPSSSLAQEPARLEYAIALHAGAGGLPPSDEFRQAKEKTLREALETGRRMLAEGRSSLDTVEAVVRIMEDSPYVNAGRGAVFNAAGGHELDASIMDGRTRAGGAVGGVTTVKNPISLARLVMTKTPHLLLVTDGAEKFADEVGPAHGITRVPNTYFSTDQRRRELEKAREADAKKPVGSGTCGCVALDKEGNLAAATSTGGLTNKRYGRIGDTPILSAGTYADNRTCAVSCTGTGEDFIRYAVAFDVAARIRYAGATVEEAARAVLHEPEQLVRGGLIAVDRHGRIAMPFNSKGMARAAADSTGWNEVHVAE
jgi:beta-aspartyl-peptidase (threonine type)